MVYGFGKIKSEIIIYLSFTKRRLRILHFSLIIKMRSDKMKKERVGYWLARAVFVWHSLVGTLGKFELLFNRLAETSCLGVRQYRRSVFVKLVY